MADDGDEEELNDWVDSSDVELLRRVWRNEKLAPELLAYQVELVDRIREQIALLEENLTAYSAEAPDELMLSLYRMDVDRTLFLLRSYLRTRLHKIEKFVLHILTTRDMWERLSTQEQEYAQRYVDSLQSHIDLSLLSKMPEGYKSMVKQASSSNDDDMIVEPPVDTFVFCKCRDSVGTLQLDAKGEETVDLSVGDLYILHYKPVKRLLEMNRIELH